LEIVRRSVNQSQLVNREFNTSGMICWLQLLMPLKLIWMKLLLLKMNFVWTILIVC
jgi:hypothetical protein